MGVHTRLAPALAASPEAKAGKAIGKAISAAIAITIIFTIAIMVTGATLRRPSDVFVLLWQCHHCREHAGSCPR